MSRPSERAEAEPYTCNAVVLAGSALLEAERILAGAEPAVGAWYGPAPVWDPEPIAAFYLADGTSDRALLKAAIDAALPELDRLAAETVTQ